MMTPSQRRVAILTLVDEFEVSERRACSVVSQHRSTRRHCTKHRSAEAFLRVRIRAIAVKYSRYGYRRIHVMLRYDGFQLNRKRVQRLWRPEGLHVQRPKQGKPKVRRHPIVERGQCPEP